MVGLAHRELTWDVDQMLLLDCLLALPLMSLTTFRSAFYGQGETHQTHRWPRLDG